MTTEDEDDKTMWGGGEGRGVAGICLLFFNSLFPFEKHPSSSRSTGGCWSSAVACCGFQFTRPVHDNEAFHRPSIY